MSTVDSPRGDDIVRKAGGHLAVDRGTVDLNVISSQLWERCAKISGWWPVKCDTQESRVNLATPLPNTSLHDLRLLPGSQPLGYSTGS